MRLLLSNDDGADSPFLPIFAEELSRIGEVEIVVPAREQSWIGRAYNRHCDIVVEEREFCGFAWASLRGQSPRRSGVGAEYWAECCVAASLEQRDIRCCRGRGRLGLAFVCVFDEAAS